MNKLTFAFVAFFAALLFVASSCKKGGGEDTPQPEAKYLTASSFAGTTWTGQTQNKYDATLQVSSETQMVYTYYVLKTLSKNTEETPVKVIVKIAYSFDEVNGKFTGAGDDSFNYSGTLKSTSTMDFVMSGETVALSKK